MQEILFKIRYYDRGVSKCLKKLTSFFFQTQSLLMDRVIKNKRGLELVTSHSSGYETSSQNSFICYMLQTLCYLTKFDDVMLSDQV